MADHADDGDDIDVFVYMGGDQEVPRDVTHIRIHRSVKIITRGAFQHCRNLVSIEMHDGVEIIEYAAFEYCKSLRRIKLPGVRIIERLAFFYCTKLADVEFGDKLETIGSSAFASTALRTIKILKVRVIEFSAFAGCEQLMEAELSGDLEIDKLEGKKDMIWLAYECAKMLREDSNCDNPAVVEFSANDEKVRRCIMYMDRVVFNEQLSIYGLHLESMRYVVNGTRGTRELTLSRTR
jgi:hypothetical protein